MTAARNRFIKKACHLCLMGIITIGLIPLVATSCGRGGGASVFPENGGNLYAIGAQMAVATGLHGMHQKKKTEIKNEEIQADKPSNRHGHAMAYVGGKRLILFGGYSDKLLNDTWEYNAETHTWTEININGDKPSPRRVHSMAYVGSSKCVLFGGENEDAGTYITYDETWEYNAETHTWEQISQTGPPSRRLFGMAYIGSTKCILYGGESPAGWYNDTWEYDASSHSWTEISINGDKPSRSGYTYMAYVGNNKVIQFGDWYTTGNTWEYDARSQIWTKVITGADSPPGRIDHGMAYVGGSKCVLFGGSVNPGSNPVSLGDTWEYDSEINTWTQINISDDKPSARSCHVMAYVGGSRCAMFGVSSAENTWEYDATSQTWTKYVIGGDGADTSDGGGVTNDGADTSEVNGAGGGDGGCFISIFNEK